MNKKLKVGLDIHGVIDTYPERFKLLSNALFNDGAEVHVITGVKRDDAIEKQLAQAGIQYTHYFSIVDSLEAQDAIRWEDGLPYADDAKWNVAKRDYCDEQGIDFMIDDSPIYRETFHNIGTTYLHLINNSITKIGH